MAVTGSSRGCSIPREHSSWRGKGGYISVGKNMRRLASGESVAYRENLGLFASILNYCHQQSIAVTLFISPEHLFLTHLRNTIDPGNHWQEFHYDLVQLNNRIPTPQNCSAHCVACKQ